MGEMYITQADVNGVLSGAGLETDVSEIVYGLNEKMLALKNTCNNFLNLLNVQKVRSYAEGNMKDLAYQVSFSNQNEAYSRWAVVRNGMKDNDMYRQIMEEGAMLVFQTRQLFTGEDITLDYGTVSASTPDGELMHKTFSYKELFEDRKNLHASLSAQAVKIEQNLVNYSQETSGDGVPGFTKLNDDYQQLWKKFQEAINTISKKEIEQLKKEASEQIGSLKKTKANPQAYGLYAQVRKKTSESRTSVNYFYEYENGVETAINNGWFYEWLGDFMAHLADSNQVARLVSKNEDFLRAFMASGDYLEDNIPGIRGGDYIYEDKNSATLVHQVQSKFNNRKIISFQSIASTIYNIKTILTQLESGGDVKLATDRIKALFTDPSIVEGANEYYDGIVTNNILVALKT